MLNLKHDIFSSGIVVSTPAPETTQARRSYFCNVPLETSAPGKRESRQPAARRFAPNIVVTNIDAADYYEDGSLYEGAEPGFATHLDGGFMGFEAPDDYEKLLDKWCRIQG